MAGYATTPPAKKFVSGPALPAGADLSKVAAERGIEYFLVSFVDILGTLRSKMVPAAAITQIQKDGAGFAPFAAWLDYGPDATDMVAIPDTTTLIQLPFQPEMAFVIGDCYMDGEKVKDSPRWVLKDLVAKAAAMPEKYVFKTGIEAEFFLLTPDAAAISDEKDTQAKPCYDSQALMRRYGILKEIIDSLNAVGYGIYQCDHEDANGQFEINWHYTDCLTTADRHVFFKWLTKTIAEKHGYRATFMPRPFKDLTGNGCHCHCSLWNGDGVNVFKGKGGEKGTMAGLGLSDVALNFLGGVLEKTRALCAITNPTINSFKRINGAVTNSGATWSPNRISFSGNNRTHAVRVPEGDRFEVRLADGAVNPYLLQVCFLAAGLYGLEKKVEPDAAFMKPHVNMYKILDDAPEIAHIERLPSNMLDALRALEADKHLHGLIGERFVEAFLKIKQAEWNDFNRALSAWELEKTLDC
jgi:glutamine synthetase